MDNLFKAIALGFALSATTLIPITQAQAAPYFSTTSQATKKANELGYTKINERSNGQAVYKATKSAVVKGLPYITPDVDSHNGGAWKAASSVARLGSKATRLGTYDENLNRIGD